MRSLACAALLLALSAPATAQDTSSGPAVSPVIEDGFQDGAAPDRQATCPPSRGFMGGPAAPTLAVRPLPASSSTSPTMPG